MKKRILLGFMAILAVFLAFSCSDEENPIPTYTPTKYELPVISGESYYPRDASIENDAFIQVLMKREDGYPYVSFKFFIANPTEESLVYTDHKTNNFTTIDINNTCDCDWVCILEKDSSDQVDINDRNCYRLPPSFTENYIKTWTVEQEYDEFNEPIYEEDELGTYGRVVADYGIQATFDTGKGLVTSPIVWNYYWQGNFESKRGYFYK